MTPKIIALSDTHGSLPANIIPPCDILIFAGDWSCGRLDNPAKFLTWLGSQPAGETVLVCGNHDGTAQLFPKEFREILKAHPSIHYLEEEEINIQGLTIWGSPYSPTFLNWFFMADRGDEIRKHWEKIPTNTDILVTHGPMWSVLDQVTPSIERLNFKGSEHLGCRDLYEEVVTRINPLVHICGHIHGGFGHQRLVHDNGDATECYNVSLLDENYRMVNKPTEIVL